MTYYYLVESELQDAVYPILDSILENTGLH